MSDKSAINIAIVDDHAMFRQGLIALIERYNRQKKYAVLFEAENGVDMCEKITPGSIPDIVMIDINMPLMDGYACARWLRENYPAIKIVVVTMMEDTEAVVRMLKLGVQAYLSKAMNVTQIQEVLETLSVNGFYLSEFVSAKMLEHVKNDNGDTKNKLLGDMTENERAFLELACTDLSYAEIAKKMQLSPKTIDGYRHTLFEKFNVTNRVGLLLYAFRYNLVKRD